MRSIFFLFISFFFLQIQAQVTGTIHVMGDSLAYGKGAPADALSPTNCLKKGFPKSQVINEAVNGMRSGQFLEKVQKWKSKADSQMVFVSMGGNDVMQNIILPGSFPAKKTMANMEKAFDLLLQEGRIVVYLGLKPPQKGSERLPEVSKMAQKKGVIVVDGMAGLWGTDYMDDLIHPNENGYALMCDKILQAVAEYVP